MSSFSCCTSKGYAVYVSSNAGRLYYMIGIQKCPAMIKKNSETCSPFDLGNLVMIIEPHSLADLGINLFSSRNRSVYNAFMCIILKPIDQPIR